MLTVNLHELPERELNEAAVYYAGARRGLGGYSTVLCRAAGFEPPVICTPLELPQEESE